ncbi:MAG: methylenetetrahydrofolate reductase, partial [Burkholderia ambifaria]
IKQDLGIEAMAHLSCVGEPKERLAEILAEVQAAGIQNVLALRGDPPRGERDWTPHPGGLSYSVELIRFICEQFDFSIGAACFPEVHPDAPDRASDLSYAREKVEAGATFLITQLFFDNELYFEFVEDARSAGIHVPIVPGIMPITNFTQLMRFSEMCGAEVPRWVARRLESFGDDRDAIRAFGADVVTSLCQRLVDAGVPGLHFYTLNAASATRTICERLAM